MGAKKHLIVFKKTRNLLRIDKEEKDLEKKIRKSSTKSRSDKVKPITPDRFSFIPTGHDFTDEAHIDYKYISPDGRLYIRPEMAILIARRINASVEFLSGPASKVLVAKIDAELRYRPNSWLTLSHGYGGYMATQARFYGFDTFDQSWNVVSLGIIARVHEGQLMARMNHRAQGFLLVEVAK